MTNKKRLMIIIPIVVLSIIIISILIIMALNKKTPKTKTDSTKYNLDLKIDFKENLMFSKYNIKMKLEDKEVLLNHGEQRSFNYKLNKGTYNIYFEKDEDKNIKNKYQFTIEEDTHLGLIVKSKMDTIEITKEYQYNDSNVSVEELVIDFTNTELIDKNYKKIIKELENKGFTNIKTKPVYDIEFGITKEGSIKKVNIDGNTEYKKGDIVVKDVKVVIYYHMSADKNPKNKENSTETKTKDTTPKSTINEGYFHSSNDINIAKQGTTGTYAYIKKGKEYDVYLVIDLDSKTLYNFFERNNDDYGYKGNIISGDLKSNLVVAFDFQEEGIIQESMRFSSGNPEVLSYTDNDNFTYSYEATSYSDAIRYKDKKTFK